jgi:hypothetical protein
MWSYFKKKKRSGCLPAKDKASPFNWCLFIPKGLSKSSGIFFSSIGPGIKDCKHGVLYIMPEGYISNVNYKTLTAKMAENIILEYYGVIKNGALSRSPKKTIWLKR